MNSSKIVATIGNFYDESNCSFLNKLQAAGISYLRFNLSKLNSAEDLKKRIDYIHYIINKLEPSTKIMLDIPYPCRKPRLYLNSATEVYVHKNQKIIISSNKLLFQKDTVVLNIDVAMIGTKIKPNQTIIYSDGECLFYVEKIINYETIVAIVSNDTLIYDRKSLSFDFIIHEDNWLNDYKELISSISPYSIALSFVTDNKDLIRANSYFPKSKVISKIETLKGVENVSSIAKVSDVMLGRGDLCLNADRYNLYFYQKEVAEAAKVNRKEFYLATGILSSLERGPLPSQADIIDLTNILFLRPEYIVCNFNVLLHNYIDVVETYNNICDSIERNLNYKT